MVLDSPLPCACIKYLFCTLLLEVLSNLLFQVFFLSFFVVWSEILSRDGSSLSLLVCFYCKANLSCFIVPKLKPGLEVPVLSGSSCRAVPRPGGTVFEAACCLFKENEGASEGLTPGSSAAFQRCHLCACDITGEKIGNPFSRIESSW